MNKVQTNHPAGERPHYRAYLMGEDGHIRQSIAIMAEDDHDAVSQASNIPRVHEVEVWDRGRLIIRLPTLVRR